MESDSLVEIKDLNDLYALPASKQLLVAERELLQLMATCDRVWDELIVEGKMTPQKKSVRAASLRMAYSVVLGRRGCETDAEG